MKRLIKPVVLSLALLTANAAHAADILVSELGGKVVYDKTANLSWIANANQAATNTFGVSGIASGGYMRWQTAQNWITAMDAAKYLGYSDWRLPTSDTCSKGFNCTGSQMGNLFYDGLGQIAGQDISTVHNANYSLFKNVQSNGYWSGSEYAPYAGYAWYFGTVYGLQNAYYEGYYLFVLAVRPGNVAAVPEPTESSLMLAGLGLLGWLTRRKNLHRRT